MKNNLTVGIIGGNGKMGKSLKNFFERERFNVLVSDINTEITNKELAEKSNIIILSIPLKNYKNILEDIKDYLRRDKLLMDIGSLKENEVRLMKKYHNGEILATHPLFGPEKNFKGNENSIVISKINSSTKTDIIINLFKKNRLNVIELTPEEHDKIMAFIHGFYYLMNITYLEILKNEFKSMENLEKLKTTSFNRYVDALWHIFNTQDWLIETISYDNPKINEVIEKYKKSLGKKLNLKEIRKFIGYEI